MLGNIWRRAFPSIQTLGPGSPDKKTRFHQDFPCWPSTGRSGRTSPASQAGGHEPQLAELPSHPLKCLTGDSCQGEKGPLHLPAVLCRSFPRIHVHQGANAGWDEDFVQIRELPLVYFSSGLRDNLMG